MTEPCYFRPIPDSAGGRWRLAGGWVRFSRLERLARGKAPQIVDDAPEPVLAALTAPRPPILGLGMDAPRIMGIGPAPASQKLMDRLGLTAADFDVIELNEAFAAQGLATLRQLGIADDDPRVNPNGGAIALGHPLGMSGVRITGTAALELSLGRGKRALATMCIGVVQGIALALERD